MSIIWPPKGGCFLRRMLFWVLFVDFFGQFFFFRLFLGGEKQRKGVVWVLSCFLFSFFPFLSSLFSFFSLFLSFCHLISLFFFFFFFFNFYFLFWNYSGFCLCPRLSFRDCFIFFPKTQLPGIGPLVSSGDKNIK